MDIPTYLLTKQISQAEFAKRLEVTQGFVHQIIKGKSRITAERAIQIEQVTDGAITRAELRPDLFAEAPQNKEDRAA